LADWYSYIPSISHSARLRDTETLRVELRQSAQEKTKDKGESNMHRGKEMKPVVNRSIMVPYELMLTLKEYAKSQGISVNTAIVEAIRRMMQDEGCAQADRQTD